MIVRREQALTYTLLGAFSLIALAPIAGIVLTALQPPGELASFGEPSGFHVSNFATAWDEGSFSTYLRSSAIVAVSVVAASTSDRGTERKNARIQNVPNATETPTCGRISAQYVSVSARSRRS